jgi:peptidoglycan/LPS O-acetylase OafA/YrhL
MMDEAEVTEQISAEMKRIAVQMARDRANTARWDLDVAVFFFAILIIVLILLFQGIRIEIVAPIAAFGLAMGWLMGWRKGKQVYDRFYNEELSKLV